MSDNEPDLMTESLYPLTEAAKLVPAFRETHRGTLFRWAARGLKVNGRTIRLEAVRIGSNWKTSPDALKRFAVAMTATATAPASNPAPAVRTPAGRKRASELALSKYDAATGKRG